MFLKPQMRYLGQDDHKIGIEHFYITRIMAAKHRVIHRCTMDYDHANVPNLIKIGYLVNAKIHIGDKMTGMF